MGVVLKKAIISSLVVAVVVSLGGGVPVFAEQMDISVIDSRISMKAEAVGLGELLSTLDRAAGTQSNVPVELAGRNVSVEFVDLDFDDAVEKIFEGLQLDYVVIGGQRIMVMAVSGVAPGNGGGVTSANNVIPSTSSPALPILVPAAPPSNPFQVPGFANQAGVNRGGANQLGVQQQPAVVQTPFGPLVNPRANAAGQAEPTGPLSMPGQSTFGGLPGMPAAQPSTGQPSIFGSTSPTIMDLNKQQPGAQSPTTPTIPPGTSTPSVLYPPSQSQPVPTTPFPQP